MILPLLSVALTCFMLGRWSIERTTQYRMGEKILDNAQTILDHRQFVGESSTITVQTSWKARGHDWVLAIKEKELSQ